MYGMYHLRPLNQDKIKDISSVESWEVLSQSLLIKICLTQAEMFMDEVKF